VKRQFRLTSSTDFERVRQTGRSFPHPLIVLVAMQNQAQQVRVGVAAGKGIGGAVVRNRAKRLLRACIHPLVADIPPGWDLIFFARKPLPKAGFWKTQTAVEQVLRRAGLLNLELARDER
jgi:ribonuclease P protein component